MADLEKMAVRRDRRYVLRLLLFLGLGLVASVFIFMGLTGERFSGCAAEALLGAPESKQEPPDTKRK